MDFKFLSGMLLPQNILIGAVVFTEKNYYSHLYFAVVYHFKSVSCDFFIDGLFI